MPIGDYLYVKWRLKETGEVYEDTVDLRQRLPKDISEHRIYFDIQGAQLHVYLVSPDFLPKGAPRNSLRMYPHNRVMALYPDPSPR